MSSLLAYPIRFSGKSFLTVEDGDDACYAQELACLIMTVPGERDLAPNYGINDPTFDAFSRVELESKIDDFGPPVRITDFSVKQTGQRADVRIVWEPNTPEDSNAEYDDEEESPGDDDQIVVDPTEDM